LRSVFELKKGHQILFDGLREL